MYRSVTGGGGGGQGRRVDCVWLLDDDGVLVLFDAGGVGGAGMKTILVMTFSVFSESFGGGGGGLLGGRFLVVNELVLVLDVMAGVVGMAGAVMQP